MTGEAAAERIEHPLPWLDYEDWPLALRELLYEVDAVAPQSEQRVRAQMSNERRLLWAILEEAVRELRELVLRGAEDGNVVGWMQADHDVGDGVTFAECCATIGVEPDWLRKELATACRLLRAHPETAKGRRMVRDTVRRNCGRGIGWS